MGKAKIVEATETLGEICNKELKDETFLSRPRKNCVGIGHHSGVLAETNATAKKTSLEKRHLGNGDYAIIASSSHPLLLTGLPIAIELVEEPLRQM